VSSKKITLGTVIKLAVASLVVGWLLSVLGVTPQDLMAKFTALGSGLWDTARDFLGWAGSYMLVGALVVLPIWLVLYVWGRLRAQ
jgi:hypothetical protein